MTTPYWVQDAIFYQIFPDRFANGDPANDPPNVHPWNAAPTNWNFAGGDLRGIIQHLDYLLDLGINALYLNPIFLSTSNHRYNTSDYFQIDPKLGTMADFHMLLDAAHRNNLRVILDGVFNHCGRGFFAFVDVLENGENSPYKDWFHIHRFPLDAYTGGDAQNYLGWWNHKSLPKLNTGNPQVRDYILNVARYWIEQGTDGWRLDVPNDIDDDGFWEEFRHVVKSANRDAYLVGEIWDINPRWANDTHFDGLMNYPFREGLIAYLQNNENSAQFGDRVDRIFAAYSRENLYAMYVPLGSHDTERIKTMLGANLTKVKLAFLIQMAFPGAPALYYGDEIGLEGMKDPDSRRAFPWQESDWNQELRQWVRMLIALRKRTPSLRRGDYVRLLAVDGLYVFGRSLGEESVLVAINASDRAHQFEVPCAALGWKEGRAVQSLIDGKKFTIANDRIKLNLPAWSGNWIS
ncbi:MAG TPA: glycoside hydrolase family 13 protein [Anaerolineales bacterium]|nr:glycoside hydrolase family 13 protein [Anaerolineales bacterium]